MASITKATRQKGVVYVARWYDANRVQQTKTFPLREQAVRHVRAEEARAAAGDAFDTKAGRAPFGPIAGEWLASKAFGKPRTREGYESLLNTHISPTFGSTPVNRITKADIQSWVNKLSAEGVGAGTIRNALRTVLKPALDFAVDHSYIRSNPVLKAGSRKSGIDLPKSERVEMCFLDAKQLRLLAECIDPHYSTLVLFAGFTGLRSGEIEALRVGRLDLMRRTVRVKESVSVVNGKGLTYGPTKTYAERSVPVPSFLVDPLMSLVAPRASNPQAFVFTTPTGGALRHGTFMRHVFKPAVEKAVAKVEEMVKRAKAEGVEPDIATFPAALRFHDLRHSAAALMIDSNANPYAVSKRLGHSSIEVTYGTYGHRFPHADEVITKGLEDAWAATERKPDDQPEAKAS